MRQRAPRWPQQRRFNAHVEVVIGQRMKFASRYSGITVFPAALAVVAMLATPSRAAQPVAIVEDIDAPNAGVQFFDYMDAGKVIELGKNGMMVLGYFASCQRETITGGTVRIGDDASEIENGRIERERVECDGGGVQLSAAQTGKSGVLVFRVPGKTGTASQPEPTATVYATAPLIDIGSKGADGAGTVVLERVDRPSESHTVNITGRIADLAKAGVSLHPGGVYRVWLGDRSTTFKVDDYAAPGGGPIISRLVRF